MNYKSYLLPLNYSQQLKYSYLLYDITDLNLWPLVLGFASAKLVNVIKKRKKDDEEEEETERSGGRDSGGRGSGREGSEGRESGGSGGRDDSETEIRPLGRPYGIHPYSVGRSADGPTFSYGDVEDYADLFGIPVPEPAEEAREGASEGPERGRR